MAKATKLPSGNYRCRIYVGKNTNGKAIYKSFTEPTKKKAELRALEFQMHNKEITQDTANMKLSEAIDKYIESKANILSPATIRGYRVVQRNAFQDLMNLKLNKINNQKLQISINNEAKIKSEKTLRNEYGLLKTVMKIYAPDILINISLPQREKFETQTLSLLQVQQLLNAIKGDDAEIALYLAICLGLRASEIAGLTWGCYNSTNKTISVKQALVPDEHNKLVKKGTKTTNSTRLLKVPDFLAQMLDSKSADSNTPIIEISLVCIRKHLSNICKKNNIPHIRLHDLRHINASIMLLLNIPQKYAMERGGWDNIQTMDKIYQYTFKDEKELIDDKINDFFDKNMTQKMT